MSINLDFSEFQNHSIDDWINSATKNLKGLDLNKLLTKDSHFGYLTKGIYFKNSKKISDINEILSLNVNISNSETENINILNINELTNKSVNPDDEIALSIWKINDLINQNSKIENIEINLSVGSNFLIEIAKFRALKYLIIKYSNFIGVIFKFNIVAKSCDWNKSNLDKENNILRMSAEALSAKIGGANLYSYQNFDLNNKNDFSNRISSNIQNLIDYESNVNHINNSADGSYSIEEMTFEIAENSWIKFQELMKLDLNQIKNQYSILSNEFKSTNNQNLETRKRVLVGVNKYPNSTETINFDTLGRNEFENIRIKANEIKNKLNQKPEIYILNIGSLSDYKARNEFVTDFYKVGGFEIKQSNGQELVEDALNLINVIDTKIIIICSSDKIYDEILIPLLNGIKSSQPEKYIILAGNVGDNLEKLKQIGLDDYIFKKNNIKEKLNLALEVFAKIEELN